MVGDQAEGVVPAAEDQIQPGDHLKATVAQLKAEVDPAEAHAVFRKILEEAAFSYY